MNHLCVWIVFSEMRAILYENPTVRPPRNRKGRSIAIHLFLRPCANNALLAGCALSSCFRYLTRPALVGLRPWSVVLSFPFCVVCARAIPNGISTTTRTISYNRRRGNIILFATTHVGISSTSIPPPPSVH